MELTIGNEILLIILFSLITLVILCFEATFVTVTIFHFFSVKSSPAHQPHALTRLDLEELETARGQGEVNREFIASDRKITHLTSQVSTSSMSPIREPGELLANGSS